MSVIFDFSRLRSGHNEHLDRRFEPSSVGLEVDHARVSQPAHLVADAHRDAKKLQLAGRVQTTLECDCSRCLDPFTVPVDESFDLVFLPSAENAGDSEREVGDDDVGVGYYREELIDLGDVVREQCYLAIPMKPLCREDCRGLCPVCGVNRNRENCTCEPAWTDPRLEPLRKLRQP